MVRAADVFAGTTMTIEDDRQDCGEVRYITVGFVDEATVVSSGRAATTQHGIISMRRANERERRLYGPRI